MKNSALPLNHPGHPGAPSVLTLHGFTGGGLDFSPLADALPELTWQAPDLPGHGSIAISNEDCGLAASLACVDSLVPPQGDGKQILLGYSLGGRLALRYALEYPDRFAALVLISASPGIANLAERAVRQREDELLAGKILAEGIPAFLAHWQRQPLIASQTRLPQPWRDAMHKRRLQLRAPGLAASLREFGQGVLEPVWNRLGELRLPTLLCAGLEDQKYALMAAEMLGGCPGAELLLIPSAGHLTHLENCPAFTTGLRAFLRRQRLLLEN